jgi:hypothetical protein
VNVRDAWSDARLAAALPGHMGVYELADDAGRVIYIGCAGGRSRFGLRGEVQDALARIDGASRFRIEITTAYLTRHRELLMRHQAVHGGLPAANEPVPGLGRLSPG